MTIDFTIQGQQFTALNGGPMFTFSPAVSFVVNCENQEEIDYYRERLSEGGQVQAFGWLQDRVRVSWQVVPIEYIEMLACGNKTKIRRVSASMLTMKKLDLAELRKAFNGES